MAMMCRTRLMRRLPTRDSRWRRWSPEDASNGAVPFQEAKCAAVRNRLMSLTAAGQGLTFGELAASSAYEPVARAQLLHLLWYRRLGVDLAEPLADRSVVVCAA